MALHYDGPPNVLKNYTIEGKTVTNKAQTSDCHETVELEKKRARMTKLARLDFTHFLEDLIFLLLSIM